jgi:predicted DNA-binding protein YlxM (UPF0122 family)
MNTDERQLICDLYPFYSGLLTEKQQRIVSWYYAEDLSLSEIAENLNISRAAVSETLATCRQALTGYEAKLHLLRNYLYRQQCYQQLTDLKDERVAPIVNRLLSQEEEN